MGGADRLCSLSIRLSTQDTATGTLYFFISFFRKEIGYTIIQHCHSLLPSFPFKSSLIPVIALFQTHGPFYSLIIDIYVCIHIQVYRYSYRYRHEYGYECRYRYKIMLNLYNVTCMYIFSGCMFRWMLKNSQM